MVGALVVQKVSWGDCRRVYTLNGISLTVASLPKLAGGDEVHFDVALIPHTLDVTTFKDMKVGDQVNLEIDVLARYMEGLLSSCRITFVESRVNEFFDNWRCA